MVSYEQLNELPTDVKILIANALELVNKTQKMMKERSYEVDLPGKTQLKSDCKAIEKKIKEFSKGKATDKDVKELEVLVVRLNTSAAALLGMK